MDYLNTEIKDFLDQPPMTKSNPNLSLALPWFLRLLRSIELMKLAIKKQPLGLVLILLSILVSSNLIT